VTNTFFFYDLETTGISPREDRIMQFAGQRTDMDLKPVGEPINILIKITPDVLPEPDAIMVTGITPQDTLRDGITEAEFVKLFHKQVATPGTIFVGFNTVRFDDEFMRFMLYRNFCDPYDWQWKDDRSRWDILDLTRMTRALRPDGIEWPFTTDGKPTVRLEYLTKVNGLDHQHAHDALNDVYATIAITKLIKDKQPKLFSYLLQIRNKKNVCELVESRQPFIYTSGKYDNAFQKTTAVVMIAKNPKRGAAVVFDLRHDPTEFLDMTPAQLAERWKWVKDRDSAPMRLPAKTLQYNRCPAIAPLSVLDAASQERLSIDLTVIEKHRKMLEATPKFAENITAALELMDAQQQTQWIVDENDVDCQLYDGFMNDHDARLMSVVRAALPEELTALVDEVQDKRLKCLLPLYKARNYPGSLTAEERAEWDNFCKKRLFDGGSKSKFARFGQRLNELSSSKLTQDQQFALEELRLYAESIMPAEIDV
jgi:exodeoxyribonuclease-1